MTNAVNVAALGSGPALYASASTTTSLPSSTYVKILFDTKQFDTANCFNTSTYRYTPNVAGYYQVTAALQYNGTSTTTGFVFLSVYKNGNSYITGNLITALQFAIPITTTLVYCNGTTDYLEIYGYQSQGSTQTVTGQYFQAVLVRGAQ